MLHLLLALNLATAPLATPRPLAPEDSIGVTVKGGKTYLKHKIGKGDTFYSLARRYHVPMAQIVAANPKVQGMLSIGQVVLVPRATTVLTDSPKGTDEKPVTHTETAKPGPAAEPPHAVVSQRKTHTVQSGETLSGIARKHHTTVAALRRLNNLKSDALRLKQVLVIADLPTARTAVTPTVKATEEKHPEGARDEVAKADAHSREEVRKEEVRREEPTRTEATAEPRRPTSPLDAADDTTAGTEVAESLRKVTESGTAEVIEASGESAKYLALHRTAPVGTILQVKNPQNGQSVYVRVIGKLPPTGANENVIIRLSKRAVQKLGAVDGRFRVEVSYMP